MCLSRAAATSPEPRLRPIRRWAARGRLDTRRPLAGAALVLALLLFAPVPGWAQSGSEEPSRFRDPDDGAFDMSAQLASASGFLPIVNIITEPALDYGLMVVPAFFHRPAGWSLEEARAAFDRGEVQSPPSITVGAAAYTLNDSWFVGGGHLGIWQGDRLRYTGFGGYGRFNLSLVRDVPDVGDVTYDYTLEGWGLIQGLRWRLGGSPWLVGGRYSLAGMTATLPEQPGNLEEVQEESRNGALGLTVSYDGRDNFFTPNRGVSASLDGRRYDDALLGDYDYWEGALSVSGFVPLPSVGVLGLRGKGTVTGDGAPFWGLPSVGMRGVPARQYVGSWVFQAEAELRWDLNRRWSLVGFGGAGWTDSEAAGEDRARTVGGGGAGFRYLLARAFGVRAGGDLAWGPDGVAFYLTVGSAFR